MVIACFSAASSVTAATAPAETTPAPATSESEPVPAPGRRLLRKILIAESVDAAIKLTAPPNSSFVVLSPGLSSFDAGELNRRLAPGENRPIDEKILAAISQVIEGFMRQNDFPAAQAVVPTQNIGEGEVKVIVFYGKIRNINVQGTRWFSESLLREKLRLEQGGIVRFSELDQAINWTNNNPFRRVRVQLDPIPNTGEADLNIAVQETMPLRFSASYDNTGNEVIGVHRYNASVTYANLWGWDHQASYTFLTSNRPEFFKGHSLDYRIPLRWRHDLQFTAAYIRAEPQLYGGAIEQDGKTITADFRYTIPIKIKEHAGEVYGAFNYKQSNNNLGWSGDVAFFNTTTDIFQFSAGGSLVIRDRRGAWGLGGSFTFSPGNINNRNTTEAFDASRFDPRLDSARFGASATYAYVSLSGQRLLNLGKGWDLLSRGVVQAAQTNLLASEQLSIGGASTIRGYDENQFSGDQGFVLSTDLLLPAFKAPVPLLSKKRGPLEGRFLAFVDTGDTAARTKFSTDGRRYSLTSAGIGVRMNFSSNFAFSADYGWQLNRLPAAIQNDHSRGHIRVSLAY